MKKSISIYVPAYNEEKNIAATISNLDNILKNLFEDYEILLFDDCSTDNTPIIVDELAKKNDKIVVVHNKKNKGLGYNYKVAVKLAKKEFFSWIPGDNDVRNSDIERAFLQIEKADIIIPYICNQRERAFLRRVFSRNYVNLLNFLFRFKLKYYNGFIITKTSFIKDIQIYTDSFAFQSETLIKLLKKGYSYIEVPYHTIPQEKSEALRLKNLFNVGMAVINLFFNVYFKK